MLIIRRKQMGTLSEYMLKQFEDRMVVHLQSTFPDKTKEIKEHDLRNMIQAGIDKADEYDVTDEVDVERFLECMVRYSQDFDTDPKTSWAGQILQDKDLSGTEKMNQIDDYELSVLTQG